MNSTSTQTKPICPFCGQPIDHLEKVSGNPTDQFEVYICPICHKILTVQPTTKA